MTLDSKTTVIDKRNETNGIALYKLLPLDVFEWKDELYLRCYHDGSGFIEAILLVGRKGRDRGTTKTFGKKVEVVPCESTITIEALGGTK